MYAPQTAKQITENNVTVCDTGIYDSSSVAYDGTGTIVAILDTGLDYTHSAFQTVPTGALYNKDMISKLLPNTVAASLEAEQDHSLTADQLYHSAKVPFQYDYADKDYDVYPMVDHGTHVAGIITGQDDVITGVATNAQLAIMKVFSNKEAGAGQDAIIAALEDAAVLNVDVINMSLGNSAGFARANDEYNSDLIYDKIADLGISLVVAVAEDSTVYLEINKDMTVKYNGQVSVATIDAYGVLTFDVDGVTYTMSSTGSLSASGVDTPYVLTKGQTVALDDFAGVYASEAGKVVISDEEIKYLGETVIDYTLGYTDLEFTLVDGSEVVLILTDDGISALVTPVDGDATTVAYASYEAITLGDFTGAYLAAIVDEGDHLIFLSPADN